jgi:DNA-binding GntR family transcriptional regulator
MTTPTPSPTITGTAGGGGGRLGPVSLSEWASPFKQTKESQVADFLRERIICGFFARGQKLKQAEIAAMLDISITPVREALKMLEAQGFCVGTSHKGVVVAPFQIDRTEELLQLRRLLEGRLVTAALRSGTIDLKRLTDINDCLGEAAAAADHDEARRCNYRFHFALYESARQPQTLEFVRALWAKFPFDLMTTMPGRQPRVQQEHAVFLEAVASGQMRAAARAMDAHIRRGWIEFRSRYPMLGSTPPASPERR